MKDEKERQVMKDAMVSEDDFDQTLRSLAQGSPPPGMEDRILHRLRERREESVGAGIGVLAFANRRSFHLAMAGAMAAAAVSALAFSLHHHAIFSQPHAQLEADSRPLPALHATPPPTATAMHHRLVSAKRPAARRPAAPERTVSFPAPEAPLTHEEKLLLVIARSPQPAMTAALDLAGSTETIAPSNHQLQASFHNDNPGGFK